MKAIFVSRPRTTFDPETIRFIKAAARSSRERDHRPLDAGEVLQLLHSLGYQSSSVPWHRETDHFAQALEHYKHKHRRPFPRWSEVLLVAYALGYRVDRSLSV